MLTYKVLEATCGIVVSHINNSAVITHIRKIGELGVPGGILCSSGCNIFFSVTITPHLFQTRPTQCLCCLNVFAIKMFSV